MKKYFYILFFIQSGFLFAQTDSVKTNHYAISLAGGSLLPDFNGFIVSGELAYVKKRMQYALDVDFIRYDYLNLKQIDYKGFAGSLNSIGFVLGPHWEINKFNVGASVGVFGGYAKHRVDEGVKDGGACLSIPNNTFCEQCSKISKTVYEPIYTFGFKFKSNINYQIKSKWYLGLNYFYWLYNMDLKSKTKSSITGLQLGINYIIH